MPTSLRLRCGCAAIAFVVAASIGNAQTPAVQPNASRAELERLAEAAERTAATGPGSAAERQRAQSTAAALRERLRTGDLHPGDMIALTVQGDTALTDTFTVRPGRILSLPGLPDLSVAGLLRSELDSALVAHLARLFREPRVQVVPLVRLAVLGQVQRPGYYAVASDASVGDAVMLAGGPTTSASMEKSVLRRRGERLLDAEAFRDAIASGATVGGLGLLAGDEIVVPERSRRNTQAMLSTAAVVMTAISAYLSIRR